MEIMLVVEDAVSDAVMRRLVTDVDGLSIYQSFIAGGATVIRSRLDRFCTASRGTPHIVLIDQDRSVCASHLLGEWGVNPRQHPRMLIRVAVREVESWLLADKDGIGDFLKVPVNKVPKCPDDLDDPKLVLVNLARKSKNKRFSAEMVPANGSRAQIGPLYNTHLSEFVRNRWNVDMAGRASPSLAKARVRLQEFAASYR